MLIESAIWAGLILMVYMAHAMIKAIKENTTAKNKLSTTFIHLFLLLLSLFAGLWAIIELFFRIISLFFHLTF